MREERGGTHDLWPNGEKESCSGVCKTEKVVVVRRENWR